MATITTTNGSGKSLQSERVEKLAQEFHQRIERIEEPARGPALDYYLNESDRWRDDLRRTIGEIRKTESTTKADLLVTQCLARLEDGVSFWRRTEPKYLAKIERQRAAIREHYKPKKRTQSQTATRAKAIAKACKDFRFGNLPRQQQLALAYQAFPKIIDDDDVILSPEQRAQLVNFRRLLPVIEEPESEITKDIARRLDATPDPYPLKYHSGPEIARRAGHIRRNDNPDDFIGDWEEYNLTHPDKPEPGAPSTGVAWIEWMKKRAEATKAAVETETPTKKSKYQFDEEVRTIGLSEDGTLDVWDAEEETHTQWVTPHYDLFGAFATPPLDERHISARYREIVTSNSASFGYDPGALWESIIASWSAIIPAHKIRIRPVSANENWREAARLSIVLVGEMGTKKTPSQNAAMEPLIKIDFENAEQQAKEMAIWDEQDKEERDEKPQRVTLVVSDDFSTEGLARLGVENPAGFIVHSDEVRAVFDAATRFSNNGRDHTGRSFLLKAMNSEFAKIVRSGKEIAGYPSISILGSIQPDVLHELASEKGNNDGMTGRLSFVFINKETMPTPTNRTPSHPMSLHNEMITRAYKRLTNTTQTVTLSAKAELIRERMDRWIEDQIEIYNYGQPSLGNALRKWPGFFARRCLIMHAIEHHDSEGRFPSTVSAETAHQVFVYMTEFLFDHLQAFHNLAEANDEHAILRNIIEYALVHRLKTFTANELAHGSRQLAKIDRPDLKRFMYKLEALGYGKIMVAKAGGGDKKINKQVAVRHDSIAFEVNPIIYVRHAELAKKLRERNELWAANWKAAQERKKNSLS